MANPHYPDDGTWPEVGTRVSCGHCRRAIVYTRRNYWLAFGPYGPDLPKSRRCTSRNPAIGYRTCEMPRNHGGACHGDGYVWWRGHGHARPFLVSRPSWDTKGSYR